MENRSFPSFLRAKRTGAAPSEYAESNTSALSWFITSNFPSYIVSCLVRYAPDFVSVMTSMYCSVTLMLPNFPRHIGSWFYNLVLILAWRCSGTPSGMFVAIITVSSWYIWESGKYASYLLINPRSLTDFCGFRNEVFTCWDGSDSDTRPKIWVWEIFYSKSEVGCGIELLICLFRRIYFFCSPKLATNIRKEFPSVS